MYPRRFKAPFLRRTHIWEKADGLRSRFPSCATLPVPVLDLAEFDLHLELVPKARLKQAGDIEALLLGGLKTQQILYSTTARQTFTESVVQLDQTLELLPVSHRSAFQNIRNFLAGRLLGFRPQ